MMQNWVLCYLTSETLTGVTQTVLGVDNAKSGICYIYVWMVHMPLKRACGCLFSPKNTAF